MAAQSDAIAEGEMEIISQRIFDASRQVLFDAFANPDHLKIWWGPKGFTNSFDQFDFHPGGAWRFTMHGPDGAEYRNESQFAEIVPSQRIVLRHLGPMHRFNMTMTFEPIAGKTALTWRMLFEPHAGNAALKGFITEANEQNFDRLTEFLLTITGKDKAMNAGVTSNREIVVTRHITAPRDLVFGMFTDASHVGNWWGPNGFTTTTHEMDVCPGGKWRYTMHGPDGADYPNRMNYSEVVRPERLAYFHDGDEGGDPAHAFHGEITFTEHADGTLVRLRLICRDVEQAEALKKFGAPEGGNQTLARLDAYAGALTMSSGGAAASKQTFVISRVFKAPSGLVYAALTDPERMKHWWGPKGVKVIASKMDLRPGGTYHYGMQTPDGSVIWGRFVFREIVEGQRIELINSFSDEKGGLTRHPGSDKWPLEMHTTFLFEKVAGGTKFTVIWKPHHSDADERAIFANGMDSMNQGWTGTLDQLQTYLATLTA